MAAINDTRSLRAIAREIRAKSYAQKKYIDRVVVTIKPKKTPGGIPFGEVRIKQQPIPLIAFKTRASKRRGVVATTGPGQPQIVLRHAFKATMPNGKVGIFMRGKKLPSKGPNAPIRYIAEGDKREHGVWRRTRVWECALCRRRWQWPRRPTHCGFCSPNDATQD